MKDRSPEEIVEAVVQELAEVRKAKGLSYEKLAEMTGLHRTGISLIERGERQPSLLNVLKIAKALDVNFFPTLKTKA